MTFKELNRINSEIAFKESRLLKLYRILLLLTLSGSVIIVLWQVFDRYYLSRSNDSLFWLRAVTIAIFS